MRMLALILLTLTLNPRGFAEERLNPDGIEGSLVLVGGGGMPESVHDAFRRLAGGDEAKLVIIPTASKRAETEEAEKLLAPWKDRKFGSVSLLHAQSREEAEKDGFAEPLREATAVWFMGGAQSRIADAYVGTPVEKELHALLERGGVIGGTSAGAAVMSRVMITGGKSEPEIGKGFDLLPGFIVDQHFNQRKRRERLVRALKMHPGSVGVGIDEGTALIVRGRRMYARGDNQVSLILSESEEREEREIKLQGLRGFADLTALRRAAAIRAGEPFPPKKSNPPIVEKGSLVIVGGGGMPKEIVDKFIELAGGPDAPIVILPTAMPDPLPKSAFGKSMFERAGAKDVTVLPARKLSEVEDAKNLATLKRAKAIWFGGGRQWRFVDAYEKTKAHDLFHDVLKRGGVIGGSSAGASIQGEYMARGNPLGNLDIMAEGYEQGLGFLPGAAIDQHFGRRKRFKDMTSLVDTYPQILGIGIDEATALIVQGGTGEVMGRGNVYFYDRRKPVKEGEPDYETVHKSGKYDLESRKVLDPGEKRTDDR